MTISVVDTEVKEIIKTDRSDISPFISMADLVIVEDLSNKGMSDARLKQIKIFLSAHYLAVADGELKREEMGDAASDYDDRNAGFGFNATRWGRQAMALDESNMLQVINEGDKGEIVFDVF